MRTRVRCGGAWQGYGGAWQGGGGEADARVKCGVVCDAMRNGLYEKGCARRGKA